MKEEFRKLFGAMGKGQEEFDEDWEKEMQEDLKKWSQQGGGAGEESMDKEIEEDEVRKVVIALKDRKAVGKDGIPAEVFKYGGEAMIKALTGVISSMFRKERVPKEWMRSIIFPIPKKLGTQEVKNYRGISLIPVVMKVYGLVLLNRLKGFCKENGLLVEEQFGFREKRGTRDALFVYKSIFRERKKIGLYVAYLDIKKAHLSVRRKALWWQLWKMGIRGRMWMVLKSLYGIMESCVVGDEEYMDFEVGLRQGCVLAPLFFSLFMNVLVKGIRERVKGVRVGDAMVAMIMFADDIVLTMENGAELQKALDECTRFSWQWGLVWNTSKGKSEVMIWRGKQTKKGYQGTETEDNVVEEKWWLDGRQMWETETYVYLGLLVGREGIGRQARERIIEKARRQMWRMWALVGRERGTSALGKVRVWQTMVQTILEMGGEFMDDVEWAAAEKLQEDDFRS